MRVGISQRKAGLFHNLQVLRQPKMPTRKGKDLFEEMGTLLTVATHLIQEWAYIALPIKIWLKQGLKYLADLHRTLIFHRVALSESSYLIQSYWSRPILNLNFRGLGQASIKIACCDYEPYYYINKNVKIINEITIEAFSICNIIFNFSCITNSVMTSISKWIQGGNLFQIW